MNVKILQKSFYEVFISMKFADVVGSPFREKGVYTIVP